MRNKTSVWQIGDLYYVWLDDVKRYFCISYTDKNQAFHAAGNLSFGAMPPKYQLITEKDIATCRICSIERK